MSSIIWQDEGITYSYPQSDFVIDSKYARHRSTTAKYYGHSDSTVFLTYIIEYRNGKLDNEGHETTWTEKGNQLESKRIIDRFGSPNEHSSTFRRWVTNEKTIF